MYSDARYQDPQRRREQQSCTMFLMIMFVMMMFSGGGAPRGEIATVDVRNDSSSFRSWAFVVWFHGY
jgi:hypothetical protein